ncbi:MAG: hypothetical protein K1X28_05800 [Parachlamydiales bacterium]|nr:hypothetical protein [Parachlamydiales bacterium]
MSSTEPPSRIPPRQQTHETKSARDELSSKGKVEKVREIDADEQTKKKRFMKYYRGVEEEGEEEGTSRPSPFDLYSGKSTGEGTETSLGSSTPQSEFEDVEDAVVPGPSYTPPPDVQASPEEDNDEVTEGALPQSDDFWQDFDLPDQPQPPTTFQETTGLAKGQPLAEKYVPEGKGAPTVGEHRKRVKDIHKREEEVGLLKGKVEKKQEVHEKLEKRKTEPSVFGPPGKPPAKEKKAAEPLQPPPLKKEVKAKEREEERPWVSAPHEKQKELRREPTVGKAKEEIKAKKLPSPMEELAKPVQPRAKEMREAHPMARPKEKEAKKEEEETVLPIPREIGAAPVMQGEREGRGGGGKKGREEKILEIEPPSLPQLPANIQPMAMAATSQVATYLTPQTVSLFFQMVGTIFVMQGPQAVNRTEIILNNPSYANSKFYGATITIEKYATAPDSFNIRLTGSHEAVVSFKENIPSLMSAFENGNFNFRIGRIDVEYTLERPIFRRKEKGEGRGEAGGGDLGERRNK